MFRLSSGCRTSHRCSLPPLIDGGMHGHGSFLSRAHTPIITPPPPSQLSYFLSFFRLLPPSLRARVAKHHGCSSWYLLSPAPRPGNGMEMGCAPGTLRGDCIMVTFSAPPLALWAWYGMAWHGMAFMQSVANGSLSISSAWLVSLWCFRFFCLCAALRCEREWHGRLVGGGGSRLSVDGVAWSGVMDGWNKENWGIGTGTEMGHGTGRYRGIDSR